MHHSSSAIGAIAGALAKAQTELTNPEKSLTASIRLSAPTDGERKFRYAPLSSGLDIVRKCLGKHEIAAIQTTSIDKEAGMVRLVTVLAHTSGEWISSDWPVCMITEIASPRRMGAALTYARRYALFTLVGIAGEDDLDAPDLCTPRNDASSSAVHPTPMNGSPSIVVQQSTVPIYKRSAFPPKTLLKPEQSASRRDELNAELQTMMSAEELITWAHRVMPDKNSLSPMDAHAIEDSFQARMTAVGEKTFEEVGTKATALASDATPEGNDNIKSAPRRKSPDRSDGLHVRRVKSQMYSSNGHSKTKGGIDKSALTIATPKRHRNKTHLRFVAAQACLVCGREPSDAHHLRFAQSRGLGLKVSDEFTVPLCRVHHREVHQNVKERPWWDKMNIDPLKVASELWQQSTARGSAMPSEPE